MFGQFVEKRESMQTNNKMAVAPVGKLIWQMSIPPHERKNGKPYRRNTGFLDI